MSFDKHLAHFILADPVIANLMPGRPRYVAAFKTDHFDVLISSIISQQVSTASAEAVYRKLRARYNDIIDPGILAEATQEELRACGISRQKHSYITDLSKHFINQPEVFEKLVGLNDAEIITSLTAIRGIGVWTAQMFLMFALGRPNVFPVDDLGIRNAMINQYGLVKPKKKELIQIAEKWEPYKSVASWYLWRSHK